MRPTLRCPYQQTCCREVGLTYLDGEEHAVRVFGRLERSRSRRGSRARCRTVEQSTATALLEVHRGWTARGWHSRSWTRRAQEMRTTPTRRRGTRFGPCLSTPRVS